MCDRVGIIREGNLVAVEQVAKLTGRASRRVSVVFAAPIEPAELARLPDVSSVEADGARVSFTLAGELDAMIKALAAHTVLDLDVRRPTLEEVFLTYYRDDE
jgi:ABC-2 type transport system ATP-binding protein